MNLLVIIIIFNGMKWLDKCLSSVVNSSVKANLFIVDNGSTDGSIEFIKKHYPEAILIESKENLGFGKANNLGLKYALDNNYDYVYLLNQDAWVSPDTFEKLIHASKSHPEYGILSPLQTNRDMDKLDKVFVKFCPPELTSDAILGRNMSMVYQTSFVMAAHWLIPCSCLKQVGGFSPTFFLYGEDNNFIDRVVFFEKRIGIVPDCIGVHDREHREVSIEKRQFIFYSHGLMLLSNPNIDERFIKFFKKYVGEFIADRKIAYLKYFFKTMKDYKKISRNRKTSILPNAFL